MRRIVFGVLACLATAGVALPARAQAPSPSAADGDEPPARYQELVDRALAESAAGRWDEARATFREAHALFPNARTLRGIGVVAFEVRDYVDTVRNLRLALAEPRRALTDEQRREAEGLLQRALSLVARYDTSALPDDATIVVDGQPTKVDERHELLVSVGEHTVEVHAGSRTAEARLRVRGGEMEPLPVVLEATPAPGSTGVTPMLVESDTVPPPESGAPRPDPRASSETSGSRVGPIVTMAGGGALLVAGVVLFLVGQGDISEVENAPPGTEWSSVRAKSDRALVLTGLGLGLIGTGGAIGVAGTVWLVASDDSESGGSASSRTVIGGVRGTW